MSAPPQIVHYLKKYQDDPSSKVFAPLAEAYRKSGLIDEAIEIAREGVKLHPSFIGGRVALARALFDKQQYEGVLQALSGVVQEAPDNLVAQRLAADSNLMLGRVAEALDSYKMLLYFNPTDSETVRIVSELEAQAYQKGALVLQLEGSELPKFDILPVGQVIQQDPSTQSAQSQGSDQEGGHSLKHSREAWMRRIEILQKMLQRVERYRATSLRNH